MPLIEISAKLDDFLEQYAPEFDVSRRGLLEQAMLWASEDTDKQPDYHLYVLRTEPERITHEVSESAIHNLKTAALKGPRPIQSLLPTAVLAYVRRFAPSLNPLPASAGQNVLPLRKRK